MLTENQCGPQIVVSRHKIRHVQRYYKLCCCMKLVLLSVENRRQMSQQKMASMKRFSYRQTASLVLKFLELIN